MSTMSEVAAAMDAAGDTAAYAAYQARELELAGKLHAFAGVGVRELQAEYRQVRYVGAAMLTAYAVVARAGVAPAAWVGSCTGCGRAARDVRCLTVCQSCGIPVILAPVYGQVTAGRCGALCMGATGPDCSCECGGQNHGARFMPSPQLALWEE